MNPNPFHAINVYAEPTRKGNCKLITDVPNLPRYVREWTLKRKISKKETWDCSACKAIGIRPLPQLFTEGDPLPRTCLSDPENPINAHGCLAIHRMVVTAESARVSASLKVRKTGNRSRDQYESQRNEVMRDLDFGDRQEFVRNQKPFHQVRRGLCYARTSQIPKLDDLDHIPDTLRFTYLGKSITDLTDPQYHEPLVIHSSENPPTLILATPKGYAALRDGAQIIGDGTFNAAPKKFAQLYTFFVLINGESVPAIHALLPNKSMATYIELLRLVHDLVTSGGQYPNANMLKCTFHCDYEMAMISAWKVVFPQSKIKVCLFHFAQAINRKIREIGLGPMYDNDPNFKSWIRRFIGTCLLDPALSAVAFELIILGNIPYTADVLVNRMIDILIEYLHHQWTGRAPGYDLTKLDLWSHFDNTGPRTTNHAEGYHRGSQETFPLQSHPPEGEFVFKIQQKCNVVDIRISQLLSGQQPRPRSALAIQNDHNIDILKVNFHNYWRNVVYVYVNLGVMRDYLNQVQQYVGNF